MARTVRETLGSVASPGVIQRIMDAALYHAGVSTVPEDADKARRFVEGPLRASVHAALGKETAEAIIADLHPILEMAGSHVRAKEPSAPQQDDAEMPAPALADAEPSPHERTTRTAPGDDELAEDEPVSEVRHSTPPAAMPTPRPVARIAPQKRPADQSAEAALVLVATLDRSGIQRVARRLVGHATVRPVHDVFELVYALEANSKRRPLVVLDCCLPAVEPQSVAAMLGGLSEAPRVVLWGATEEVRNALEGTLPAAREWIPLSADATDEDVATLLKSLL